jgi:hypothetical protein
MKMRTLLKIAAFTVIVAACIPFLHSQNRIEVEVNWSFRETVPTAHEVTIQGSTFTVPPGETVKQTHKLKGGATVAILYAIRGWRLSGQKLIVDGEEVPLSRIQSSDKRGKLVVLGISRSPSMDSKIEMPDRT